MPNNTDNSPTHGNSLFDDVDQVEGKESPSFTSTFPQYNNSGNVQIFTPSAPVQIYGYDGVEIFTLALFSYISAVVFDNGKRTSNND